MDRLACISVPHLALQIALQRHPSQTGEAVVLVREDKPTSLILNLNRAAKNQGLHQGMRYSEALSIVCDLRAERVSSQELAAARREIREILAKWSPQTDEVPFDPGAFWVNPSGLTGLYGSESQWGTSLREALCQKRYQAVIVVGFTREGTYVLARSRRSTVVLTRQAEKKNLDRAPVSVFPLPQRTRRLLERLGIKTLTALARIPAPEILKRFGPEILRDLRQMESLAALPLQASEPEPSSLFSRRLETAVSDRLRLLPVLEELLREGLLPLPRKARVVAELRIVFVLEDLRLVSELLRPAEPTANAASLLRLIELRLSHCEFPTGVTEVRLVLEDVGLPPQTMELFAPPVVRDLRRGDQAIALIRAKLGNQAVVRAVLLDSHVPELSFRWDPAEQLRAPGALKKPPLQTAVRRIFLDPPKKSALAAGLRLAGPFLLQVAGGGALRRTDKEYWFLRSRRKEVQWVSRDQLSGLPRLEGLVD